MLPPVRSSATSCTTIWRLTPILCASSDPVMGALLLRSRRRIFARLSFASMAILLSYLRLSLRPTMVSRRSSCATAASAAAR